MLFIVEDPGTFGKDNAAAVIRPHPACRSVFRLRASARAAAGRSRSAFTLIEVLVVVAIIALLIAILIPSLQKAREQSTGAVCRANLHQLMLGMMTYTADHKALPGNNQVYWSAWDQSGQPGGKWPTWKASDSWLGMRDPETSFPTTQQDQLWAHVDATVPKLGSLYKYAKNEAAYLCPKDKKGMPDPNDPQGGGGNGRFSYTMNGLIGFKAPENCVSFRYVQDFTVMAGALPAPIATIPKGSKFTWTISRMLALVEEHPWNNTNHGWVGDSWAADSYLVFRHHPDRTTGMGMFAFVDGHAEGQRYPYSVKQPPPKAPVTFQGVDLLNKYKLPYDYAGNAGGSVNELSFMHKFIYPYND